MRTPRDRASFTAYLLLALLAGSLLLTPSAVHAAAVALARVHMAAQAGAQQPATSRFPSGVTTVYFDYTPIAPFPDDTAEVLVFAHGTSGSPAGRAKLILALTASLSAPLRPLVGGGWPSGQYCTVLYVDGVPDPAGGRMPIGWSVGNAPVPTCGKAPRRTLDVALTIDRTGIYRITDADLRHHGIEWDGLPARDLAVVSQGKPVARLTSKSGLLDNHSSVEFFGRALSTRYTNRAVYDLLIDRRRAVGMPRVAAMPGAAKPPAVFTALFRETRRTLYDPAAPGDGWFYRQIVSSGRPSAATAHVSLPGMSRYGVARLAVRVRGVSDLPGRGPQHHLVISLNGRRVAELHFSGAVFRTVRTTFPALILRRNNMVRFLLPGDVHNTYRIDAIDIKSFSLSYPHHFSTSTGRFGATLRPFRRIDVSGFGSAGVSVWRTSGGNVSRLRGIAVRRQGKTFTVSFAARTGGTYSIVGARGFLSPVGIAHVPSTRSLTQGDASLLVISPTVFRQAIRPLVLYHRTHGLTVKVVNPSAIYTLEAGGVVDPRAITRYIAFARTRLGARLVLLVGADDEDYHHYLSCAHGACPANPSDRSFIPSLYVRDNFGQIPSDEQFVARSGGGPGLAIGRIPAVTAAQVSTVVARTLAFVRKAPASPLAVFAAGGGSAAFAATSDALISTLPAGIHAERLYQAALGPARARTRLLRAIGGGARLVDFVGHGNLEQWGNPPSLLTVQDVSALHDQANPGLYLGWGCQTAYDIDPTDEALNARLLFAGGAALTIGSTGLDDATPQAELARRFFADLFRRSGVSTVGEALRLAEDSTLAADPAAIQPVQSYELFGDPALPLLTLRPAAAR